MKRLGWYLHKIERGLPVASDAVSSRMVEAGYSTNSLHQCLSVQAGRVAVIAIKDQTLFEQIKAQHPYLDNASTRVLASIGGNSHDQSVSAAMVTLRSINHPHPSVVVCRGSAFESPRELQPYALIVENLENFLHLEQTLSFAQSHTSQLDVSSCEVVWASGNSINSAHNQGLLEHFEETYWLCDADAGGLQIMANALAYLPDLTVVIPSDLTDRLQNHGKPLSAKATETISKLGKLHPKLAPLASCLFQTRKQLEQESYLLNKDER